jgi:hypothetical protein
MKEFKDLFLFFIRTLEKNQVQYCVLRGFEGLPENFSNDIDIGIHPENKVEFFKTLMEFQQSYGVKIALIDSRLDFLKTTITFQNQKFHFDFWFGFNYAGLIYMDICSILQDYTLHHTIKVLSVENEVSLSFLKELLHNAALREDKADILKLKMNKCNFESFANFFSNNLKEAFRDAILNEKFELNSLAFKTKKELILINLSKLGLIETSFKLILFFLYKKYPFKNPLVKTFDLMMENKDAR